MVEFAIMAPFCFLLILGVIVVGVLVMNQVQVSNVVRDAARAGAVCGSLAGRTAAPQAAVLPDGSACTYANFQNYVTTRLKQLSGGAPSHPSGSFGSNCDTSGADAVYCVYKSDNTAQSISGSNPMDQCAVGYKLEVVAQFDQQLFVPLVGKFFGSSNNTRTLKADVESTCEQ